MNTQTTTDELYNNTDDIMHGYPSTIAGDHSDMGSRDWISPHIPRPGSSQKTCYQQPPWWGWILMVMCTSILLMLSVLIYMGSLNQTVCNPGQDSIVIRVFKDCRGAYDHGQRTSGVYTISFSLQWSTSSMMQVYCEQELDGGGWLVFQARYDGSVNFYNDWNTYRAGFGDLTGEFWLGNENIHLLTNHRDQQLKIELTSREGEVQYADYSHFWIDDEPQKYNLTVTGYTGSNPPGDNLIRHSGAAFSTFDQDNDPQPSGSCAAEFMAGWWCNSLSTDWTSLNGQYGGMDHQGIWWWSWKQYTSLKATRMMIRRRS